MDIIYSIDPIPSAHIIDNGRIHFASFYDMLFYTEKEGNDYYCNKHTAYAEYFALQGFHIDYAVHLN